MGGGVKGRKKYELLLGQSIRISIFGQSHSAAIGVVIDGLPAGFRPDFDALSAFMARRARQSALTTSAANRTLLRFSPGWPEVLPAARRSAPS